MPRRSFPEFKGFDETKIKQYLYQRETDRSFHSDYNISYAPVSGEYSEYEISSWHWRDIARYRPDENEHPAREFMNQGDSCWGDLPYSCHLFYRAFGEFPKWLLFRFRTDPFANGAYLGDGDDYYDDDYYDEDDEPGLREEGEDLSHAEMYKYCDWLVKHKIITPFDVDKFIDYDDSGFGYIDLDNYRTMNQIYFACTMLRYMHEGQNIVRRILNFDRLFDLDPFVNTVLAHVFADYNYNGGHCVCAMQYWEREHFGGDYWRPSDSVCQPEVYRTYKPLFYAKIASAIRMEMDKVTGMNRKELYSLSNYPYFKWEPECGENFNALSRMTTPKTWRGLLSLDTRRSKCVNSALDAIQKCSLKMKAA